MAKVKDKSEVEHLRGDNRSLKAEIRHLKRELGRKDKQIKVYDQFVGDPEPAEEEAFVDESRCPTCSGLVEAVDLGIKHLLACRSCGYRRTVKKPSGDSKKVQS